MAGGDSQEVSGVAVGAHVGQSQTLAARLLAFFALVVHVHRVVKVASTTSAVRCIDVVCAITTGALGGIRCTRLAVRIAFLTFAFGVDEVAATTNGAGTVAC